MVLVRTGGGAGASVGIGAEPCAATMSARTKRRANVQTTRDFCVVAAAGATHLLPGPDLAALCQAGKFPWRLDRGIDARPPLL